MLRWLATLGILAILALDVWIPSTSLGRRGTETLVRADVPGAVGTIGQPLPELALRDLEGQPLRLTDLRGHPVLLTFERSVDW